MAHSYAAPWMLIAVRVVQKGTNPYTQSEALAACANQDPLFQTFNSTVQTTRGNERGAIIGTHFLATLFKENQYRAGKNCFKEQKQLSTMPRTGHLNPCIAHPH